MADVVIASSQAVTATGVVGSAATVSSFTDDWDLQVSVLALTSGVARIAVEDSTDGTTWATLAVFHVQGANTQEQRFQLRSYNFPDNRVGVAGGRLRLNVTLLTASSITLGATLKDV